MFFGFDDDQLALRDAVAGLLDKRAGLAYLQNAWTDPTGDPTWAVWPELAEMGVQGLMIPEARGGSGFDWVTMTLVLAETGRVALPLPLAETAAVAATALARDHTLLGAIASGEVVVTATAEVGQPAPSATRADWFIVGDRMFARDDVSLVPVRSVDRTRDAALVSPQAAGHPLAGGTEAGALATAAVLVGVGRALVAMSVEYVKDRQQFGVPVGSFQAVKHHLANAALAVEFAAPTVWAAAWEMDTGAQTAGRSVSLAKAMASDAAERAARIALQCHGAMGYTDDYHLHFWLKRVWALAPAFGSARSHRLRMAGQLGLAR
ncbi:MAG TPA: acyl-CoA dehydrogenase [Acidimicrobiales bacterium]|jgi:alkylation response protein AidB-like acyl-CoA dehydrogenase|nr:acyl-CoA dehydrogenase [Acidimicrobiales bacterium]